MSENVVLIQRLLVVLVGLAALIGMVQIVAATFRFIGSFIPVVLWMLVFLVIYLLLQALTGG
jgi:hypothetical protein